MKKIIIAVLLAATVASLAACSNEIPKEQSAESIGGQSSMESSKSEASSGEVNQESSLKAVYGKVSAAAGNELDLSIAKDPYVLEQEGSSAQVQGGGMAAAITMTEAVEGDPAAEAPKMELEYTGETKSIVVPAGVKINGKKGEDTGIEEIKKGSVIMVMMEGEKISEIAILE